MPIKVAVGLIKLTSLVVKIAYKPWSHIRKMEIRLRSPKAEKYLTDGCLKVAGGRVKGQCGMHGLMIHSVDKQECRWRWITCWCMGWYGL